MTHYGDVHAVCNTLEDEALQPLYDEVSKVQNWEPTHEGDAYDFTSLIATMEGSLTLLRAAALLAG